MNLAGHKVKRKIGSFFRRKTVSRKGKPRFVYQERLAHRQAVERLRRVYDKLYRQARSDLSCPVANQTKKSVQERKAC